jgi:hypothetical protein
MSLDEVLSQLERLGLEAENDSSEGEREGEERSKVSSSESILGAGGASQPPPPPPNLPLSSRLPSHSA